MLPVSLMKATWSPSGALGLPAVKALSLAAHAGIPRELPGGAAGRDLVGLCGQDRLLEAAVADGAPGGDRRVVEEGRAVGAGRSHTEEFDGMRAGRDREIRRLVKQCKLVLGGRDQTDLRAVDQHLDLLVLGLIMGALGGQERDAVRAGVEVDGLADAAVVLDEGNLGPVGGIGAADGEGAVIGAHPGRSRELPTGTAGRELVGVARSRPGSRNCRR